MSGLEAARDDLATLLRTGVGQDPLTPVGVLTYVPEAIQPPVLVIQPGEEYLATGDEDATYVPTEWVVSLEVWALVDLVDNQAAADDLDQIIESVVLAVGPSAWWVKTINQPGPVHTSEWMSHGVRITVSRFITL